MIDGFVAPARRVMAFLTDDAYTALNDSGRALFDAALSWALDAPLDSPSQGAPLVLRIDNASADQLTLAWEGGTGPFTVQTKSQLSDPEWTEVSTTAESTATVPATDTTGFFRVIGQ